MKKCKIVPFVHVLLKFSNISFTAILKSKYRLIEKKNKKLNALAHKIPINTKTAFLEVLEHGASLMLETIFT